MSAYTDRELLEMAAKAIGVKVWFERGVARCVGEFGEFPAWNPLDDNSLALRLACLLDIKFKVENGSAAAFTVKTGWLYEESKGFGAAEATAATRLAICRVAAEIGRLMQ